MRAIVTCECCGYRQAVARPIRRPEQFHVICHGCEGVLLVEVTSADLRQADKPAASFFVRRDRRARPNRSNRQFCAAVGAV